ncbi:MAG: cupredoxin domain-containing protein [Chloroflexi bacterium]|nr:cupredoxin domain-containing protein [Chloroflexota bacterium]
MKTLLNKKSGMARVLIIGLVLFMLAFVFGISCQAYQPAPAPAPAPAPPPPAPSPPAPTPYPTPSPAPAPAPETATFLEVTVTAKYAVFEPATITVAKGETVKLTVTSTGGSHTFTIDELGINIAVGSGQTTTKEFTVEKAGTFSFYCAVPGHQDAGMVGILEATD